MKEIKFIAVANIESSVALRNDDKESVAGHVWIKYLNLETGEIQNYGYELDGSNPFYDTGKVTHYDDELYLGKSLLVSTRLDKYAKNIEVNMALNDDDTLTCAIIDRLIYHSHIISISGQSYRLRDKARLLN
ncbi:MAG: hypothetical protein CGEMS_1686 [Candidatus Campylobacter infans]|nr:MAG: hypothetical protein CGEMS_1686 [Candidatus Campylobacter infans]